MKVLKRINGFTIRKWTHGFAVTNDIKYDGEGQGMCSLSTYDKCIEIVNHIVNKTIPENIHPHTKSCLLELATDPLYISELESTKAHLTARGGKRNG